MLKSCFVKIFFLKIIPSMIGLAVRDLGTKIAAKLSQWHFLAAIFQGSGANKSEKLQNKSKTY